MASSKKKQKIPKVTVPPPPPPPPMTSAEVEASFREYVDYQVAHLTAGIAKWKADRIDATMDDPGRLRSNLEWMDGFVEDVCELEVYSSIKNALTPPTQATIETVFEYELDSALNKARYPSHSSSYMTNFVNLCSTAAQAEATKTMRAWLKLWKEAKAREATTTEHLNLGPGFTHFEGDGCNDPDGHRYAAMCTRREDNE